MLLLTAALTLATASTVSAHFELVAPPSRNVGNGITQKVGPCGSADTPNKIRADFASLNSTIALIFYWDGDNEVFLGFGENPTTFPYKVGGITSKGGQTYAVPLDLSGVPKDILEKGGPATVQVVCHQPKEVNLFQCGDVTIAATAAAGPVISDSSAPLPPGTSSAPATAAATVSTTASAKAPTSIGGNAASSVIAQTALKSDAVRALSFTFATAAIALAVF
ncbi:hypothetical protein BJ741DRAFT_602548 [Chytriomyces cf. hyalinus JEL632]|nr:hypothetical protein BJ741DRAFT_602548 [Chytriomyces cf. hyalinus JEL632]